jgi:hypothetical protein
VPRAKRNEPGHFLIVFPSQICVNSYINIPAEEEQCSFIILAKADKIAPIVAMAFAR